MGNVCDFFIIYYGNMISIAPRFPVCRNISTTKPNSSTLLTYNNTSSLPTHVTLPNYSALTPNPPLQLNPTIHTNQLTPINQPVSTIQPNLPLSTSSGVEKMFW